MPIGLRESVMTDRTHSPSPTHLRGVNLGGWLLLEKWMKPSLFAGLAAGDETSWCVELGKQAPKILRSHWENFITRDDFAWLADVGINTVRIPFGHWILGPPYPYHNEYGTNPHPFVEGGIDVLDQAFSWAEKFGIHIILDLHAAPGCQNGFDNGGIRNVCEWHTREEYITFSVELLGRLAKRYRSEPALYGIQLLNEPRWDIPTSILQSYYLRAYDAIRAHCPPERVAVIFHDGFRTHREYLGFMQEPQHQNVIFDIHRYQCFEPSDIEMDIHGHLHKAGDLWRQAATDIHEELKLPTIIGEWSLGLNIEVVNLWAENSVDNALRRLDQFQTDVAYRAYGAAQLLSFEHFRGWFFWSYRTETTPEWCFRESVERGWLPRNYR